MSLISPCVPSHPVIVWLSRPVGIISIPSLFPVLVCGKHLAHRFPHLFPVPPSKSIHPLHPVPVDEACTTVNMFHVNDRINKLSKIDILGQTFFSKASRQTRFACTVSITMCNSTGDRYLVPARPLYYFVHRFRGVNHYFAFVEWYNPSRHSWPTFHLYDCFACHSTMQPISPKSIVPVHYIHGLAALAEVVDDHFLVRFLPRKIKSIY